MQNFCFITIHFTTVSKPNSGSAHKLLIIEFPFLLIVNKAILRIVFSTSRKIVMLFLLFLLGYGKESLTLDNRTISSSDVIDGSGKGSKTNWQQ